MIIYYWCVLIYESLVVESGGVMLVSGSLVIGFSYCLIVLLAVPGL